MKNNILTFLFALVPGAGQMYQGYMKRGLSLVTLFVLCAMAGSLIKALLLTCFIVWMYSAFDAINLRSQISAGTAPADAYIVRVDLYDAKTRRALAESHRLLGWGLIALGALAAYENIFMRLVDDLLWRYANSGRPLFRAIYLMLDQLPQVFVCVVLIICGVWFIRTRGSNAGAGRPVADEFCACRADRPEDALAVKQPAAERSAAPAKT